MNEARQVSRFRLSASATAVIVAVVVVCLGWAFGSLGDGWPARCLRSRLSLYAGAAALACLVGLYVLAGAAWRLGRERREKHTEPKDAGTAALEFALLFPFALMIVLIMIQSVLLAAGNMAVHHAAYVAARSAVVWVPDDYSYGEPRNVVESPETSGKIHRIRSAAVYAVMPVSAGREGLGGSDPGSAAIIREGLERFWELYGGSAPNWVRTALDGKYQYAWNYTEVSLSPPADGDTYGDHETLSVRVKHQLYLPVPYANRIFGESLCAGGCSYYATEIVTTCSLTNQGVEDEIDVEQFPRYEGR